MMEKESNFEKPKLPDILDLVLIDNRWAQVINIQEIRFLDNNSAEQIDWANYNLVKQFDTSLQNFLEFNPDEKFMPLSEFHNIYYDAEVKNAKGEMDGLKLQVKVFGKFEKK